MRSVVRIDEYKDKRKTMKFGDLVTGDWFRVPSIGVVRIKLPKLTLHVSEFADSGINAVDLSGVCCFYRDDHEVELLNVRIAYEVAE